MLKALIGVLGLSGAIYYFTADSGYHLLVEASQEQVASSLAGVDIREAPGAPGTDSMRSGDIPSMFAVGREGDDVVWTVTNGDQTAVRMIAHLKPVDPTHTEVTLDYQRGDAPDDHVAPAFRSRSITLGLLSMMIEEKLDSLTMPVGQWTAECDQIMAQFAANANSGPEPRTLGGAMGRTARQGAQLAALDKSLKAAGCPQGQGGFPPVREQLGESASNGDPEEEAEFRYQPGKPMIDVRR